MLEGEEKIFIELLRFLARLLQGAAGAILVPLNWRQTPAELGPILAYKLKYALDRIGRVVVEEIPAEAEGPRYYYYRGPLGRIDLARRGDAYALVPEAWVHTLDAG